MNELFVPYEESLQLKELGFDEPCLGLFVRDKSFLIKEMPNQKECKTYFGGILRPTFSQVFKFFREKYNQHHFIHYHSEPSYTFAVLNDIEMYRTLHENISFKTYEEAELACLRKLIQIVKDETN